MKKTKKRPTEPKPQANLSPQSMPFQQAGALPRLIAFYLPQFHPIPENDEWWGKGFTEWSNVTRAKPLFDGHHQPRLPADLGFYDLRLPEIMEQQAELARQHGVHGFCYYYYWFAGRRVLEKPIDRMLASGSPDFPFCLCWANENWTRRWDGSEKEVLLKQEYGPDFARRIIRDMLPFLKDRRYITVDGKPVLLVYRVDIIPDCAEMTAIWREEAEAAGLPGLYLVRVESFVELDPRPLGFDAACEFPPHLVEKYPQVQPGSIPNLVPDFTGTVYDYGKVANLYGDKPPAGYKRFKTTVPSWDNTARRRLNPYILLNSSPELYRAWLNVCLHETCARFQGDERLVFVNAWNEWAEGCYLEPDQKYGHRYLEATRDALASVAAEARSAKNAQPAQGSMDFAIAFFQNGQLEDAYAAFLKVLESEPNNPQALLHLGLIALSAGFHDDAKVFFDHAVEFSQDRASAQAAVGQQCMDAGELAYAEHYLSAAITARPGLIGAYTLLADVWQRQGRNAEALQLLNSVLDANPAAAPDVLPRLMHLARELGDLEMESSLCLRGAQYPDLHSRGIELLAWGDDASANALREQASRFGAAHCPASNRHLPAGVRKRLRVGFVIGNLASDDVRYRVEPLIRKLDPRHFETIVFANDLFTGEAAQRLYLIADHWQQIAHLDADATDQAIRDLNTDILFNLEGHRSLSGLEPFIRQSAPLQVNWSNPPMTTGLKNMDFVISDQWLDPEGQGQPSSYTEHIVRLPVPHAAYEFPEIREAEFPRKAGVESFTFGCMVPVNRISQKTWQAWSEILAKAPGTRLLLNSAELGDAARRHVLDKMSGYGVGEERIAWVAAQAAADSCEAWKSVDLGLCPLAGDSSYSALLGIWMGVPSIACASATPWGSIPGIALQQVGLDAYVAQTTQHYVELATRLAGGQNDMGILGNSLRDSLRKSPVADTGSFATAFGAALVELWQQKGGAMEGQS